jgi:hypothetical protein
MKEWEKKDLAEAVLLCDFKFEFYQLFRYTTLYGIWCSNGGEDNDVGLLGCDAM